MDIRTAVSMLILEAADDHVDTRTGEWAHGTLKCAVCDALETGERRPRHRMSGGFETGEPVMVGTAHGRVSHVDVRVSVQLENVGLVTVTPENVKRPGEIPARLKFSPDGSVYVVWKPDLIASPWLAIYGPTAGKYYTDIQVADWLTCAPMPSERKS